MSRNFELLQRLEKGQTIFGAAGSAVSPNETTERLESGNGKSAPVISGEFDATLALESDSTTLLSKEELLAREEELRLIQSVFFPQLKRAPRVVLFAGAEEG